MWEESELFLLFKKKYNFKMEEINVELDPYTKSKIIKIYGTKKIEIIINEYELSMYYDINSIYYVIFALLAIKEHSSITLVEKIFCNGEYLITYKSLKNMILEEEVDQIYLFLKNKKIAWIWIDSLETVPLLLFYKISKDLPDRYYAIRGMKDRIKLSKAD